MALDTKKTWFLAYIFGFSEDVTEVAESGARSENPFVRIIQATPNTL